MSVVLSLSATVRADSKDDYCISKQASRADRERVLDIARSQARPHRLASDTFSFCSARSLGGRWARATVETVRIKQPDGSRVWTLIYCHRLHNDLAWSCVPSDMRSIRIDGDDVELKARSEESPPIDVALARDLVARAYATAKNPPPDLRSCDKSEGATPGDFTRGWEAGGPLSVSGSGNRYYVEREAVGIELSIGNDSPSATPCWRERVVVVE